MAGIPNIVGTWTSMPVNNETGDWSGAVYKVGKSGITNSFSGNSYNQSKAGFQASKSNSIYGKSNTVTPLSESCIFCISY